MTEVRKRGRHRKVARAPFVFQLKTRTVSHYHFTYYWCIFSGTPATRKLVWACPKHSGS